MARRPRVIPIAYGDGVADRITEAAGGQVPFGGGFVELAPELGVRRQRDCRQRRRALRTRRADRRGELELVVAKAYPLDEVRDAYRELERRRTRGKIVLRPSSRVPGPA